MPAAPSPSRHPRLPVFLSILSVGSCFLFGSLLVGFHTPVSLAVDSAWLEQPIEPQRTIIHFATEQCQCSRQLLTYLLNRGPQSGRLEQVVFFGPPAEILDRLAAQGFRVRREINPEDSGVIAAPWLLIRDARGRVEYSGGYEHAPYWDRRIVEMLAAGQTVASRGTTGCFTKRIKRAPSSWLSLFSWNPSALTFPTKS